jgi:predicted transcriptional regulator
MDEEIIVIAPKSRRYKCVLSAAEIDQMLAHRISWGGLGMYATMCEYAPETLFTVDELAGLASNTRDEVEAILNELISAGYVFRTDMRVEGQSAYAINRDLLPESITEVTTS